MKCYLLTDFLKIKNVCTGFETFLKRGKRLFGGGSLMIEHLDILCLLLFISSSDLCKCIVELIHSKLEFIFDKNTCHCTFRYYLNLQTHCSICKVLYVKLFIKTIPHILKFQLAFLWPYILMWRRLKECAKPSLEILLPFDIFQLDKCAKDQQT